MDSALLYTLAFILLLVGIPYLLITQGIKKNLKICPICKSYIPKGALKCPKCQSELKP